MTLLSALRAALSASCGPLPPHRPVTEADTLRREVDALRAACKSHRRERESAERANAELRKVLDAAVAERQRARRRLIMQTRANARTRARLSAMLTEAVHLGPDLTALHYAIRCRVQEGHARDARQAVAVVTAERDAAVARAEAESANSESWAQYVRDMAEERDAAVAALAAMREALAGLP